MDNLKLFLFDQGIGIPKSEQTEEKLTNTALDLIEYQHVNVPNNLKNWYNTHRTFNLQQLDNLDVLNEMTSHMTLNELEQFCKTNKSYQHYCGSLLSKKILKEQGLYLLEQPKTYLNWTHIYKKTKDAIDKTNQLLSLLNYEKQFDLYTPWLFLMVDSKNKEEFKLLPQYSKRNSKDIRNNNLQHNKQSNTIFNLILNIDTGKLFYKYIENTITTGQIIIDKVDIYDVLYRYFYYYPQDAYELMDEYDLYFNIPLLTQQLNELTSEFKDKALRRLNYLEKY
jgi:hypothetical protein